VNKDFRGEGLPAINQTVDERVLVEAAQKDVRRFADLYELYFYRVYAYVSTRVKNREESEDITSEVFHRALIKIKTFEWRDVPFSAWLFRIAANSIVDHWRKIRHQENASASDLENAQVSDADIERQAAIFQLVESLPEDQRQVVHLRFVEQKTIREIAQQIRRSEGAVKQLQFRALKKLRTQMEGADA